MNTFEVENKNYEKLANLTPNLLCISDMNGYFKYANPAFEKILGYSLSEIMELNLYILIHPDDGIVLANLMDLLDIRNSQDLSFEFRYRCKDGSYKWIAWNVKIQWDEQLVYSSGHDISDRKMVEINLKSTTDRLQEAQKFARLGYWELDIVENKLFWSDELYVLFGLKPGEFIPTTESFYNMVNPEDKAKLEKIKKGPQNGVDSECDLRVIGRNGETIWISEKVKYEYGSNGKLIRIWGIAQDITQRKLNEVKLKEKEESYKNLTDNVPVGIYCYDKDGCITFVNPKAAEILGAPSIEAVMSNNIFTSPLLIELGISDIYKQCIESGKLVITEKQINTIWGKSINERIVITPIKDQKGDILSAIAIIEDLTETKRLEAELLSAKEEVELSRQLEEGNQKFRRLAEITFEGICILNDGMILECNRRLEAMFGYKDGELIGMSIFNIISVESSKLNTAYESSDYILLGKFFAIKKDGTSIEVEILSTGLTFNEMPAKVCVIRDNSKIKTIEESIKKTHIKLNEEESIGHMGNVEVDVLNKIINWSDETFRILGYQPKEIKPGYEVYAKHFSITDRKFIDFQLAKRTPSSPSFDFKCKFLRTDESEGWMYIRVTVEFDEEEKPIYFYMIIQDITEEKRWERIKAESELNAELLEKALETDRIKAEFLANVSHELRTPLNIIYSTLQLFETYIKNNIITDYEDKINKRLSSMKRNCYRLMRLINNLIEINKVDCGFTVLNLENIDVVAFLRELCSAIEEFMMDKNLDFEFRSDVQSKIFACDLDKLETVILNLISNAVKFNRPKGKVAVELRDKGDDLLIVVEDSGIGIAEDMRGKIFDRFEQVNKSLTRNYEGSGIGLSLSRSFIQMLGGHIWLESEFGKGSKFFISLPSRSHLNSRAGTGTSLTDNLTERIFIELSDVSNG